jgi:hypothetical protein
MAFTRNGNYRPGNIPSAHDSALIENYFSKNSIFKIDLNRLTWGDSNAVNEILNLLEDNIAKRLRENKYVGIYDFKTLPFMWRPPSHHQTCQDDKTRGEPNSVLGFQEMQKEFRYQMTPISDLIGMSKGLTSNNFQKIQLKFGMQGKPVKLM